MYRPRMVRNLRELYQYRALLYALIARELKARYRGSVLGFLWTFLNPTLLMLVYTLIFSVYMRSDVPHYTYFLFIGLLPWIWFSSSIIAGANAVSDRRDLLTKVRFPAQVLPATVIATNLCNYLLSLPLMFILGALHGTWPTWHIVFFPLVVVVQMLFTVALVFLISALNVAFRDLQYLVSNLITLWFLVTPVLYPLTTIPPEFRDAALAINPMAVVSVAYHDIFYYHRTPNPVFLLGVTGLSLVLLFLSTRVFESRREEFAELV